MIVKLFRWKPHVCLMLKGAVVTLQDSYWCCFVSKDFRSCVRMKEFCI
jgi:hypothetical protein